MRRWLFAFFLVSGFSSLVYEVVWIRLAMAAFGVTTPFVSIVISVFMGGLAVGSFAGGRLAARAEGGSPARFLRSYALAEAVVGASGLAVPWLLDRARVALEAWQGDAAWSGPFYLAVSGTAITLVLLPACVAMGATFPLAMAAIRAKEGEMLSFSRLYLANVLGATTGTLVSAFVLIELLGFRGTILVAACGNAALVAGALALAARERSAASAIPAAKEAARAATFPVRPLHVLLFLTGSLSMGMEVVWVRLFTPFMGTFVYAFALILATYLVATFLGSAAYRGAARVGIAGRTGPFVWIAAGTFALLALYAGDPQNALPWRLPSAALRLCLGIAPVAAAFGFVTPMLVDRASSGDPARAGAAYAVNVVGSILGPLFACFVLLPWLGERATMIVLALPLFWVALSSISHSAQPAAKKPAVAALVASVGAGAWLVLATHPYQARFPSYEIRRDSTATTLATGEGMSKDLYVNGISVTGLTPITKMMVHMPLAWRPKRPERVLVICFGMGTSFRSALTWDVPTTAVELVPGVADLFPYFHDDARDCLAKPGAKIVVDDGRRFLERTSERFDLIVIDPPPPVQAAASSLLYSREFYRTAKKRLNPGAILQQWLPDFDAETLFAVVLSLKAEFPYVRAFQSCEKTGLHFFASDSPLPSVTAAELASRLPSAAARDLVEWGPEPTPERQFALVLGREADLDPSRFPPRARALTDDRPINEYFLIRNLRGSAVRIQTGVAAPGAPGSAASSR